MLETRASSTLIFFIPLLTLCAPAQAQTLAITGATIIDGTGSAPVSDGVVVIVDGRIVAVGSSSEVAIPDAARRLDAQGKYLIPGLMDANLHLASRGGGSRGSLEWLVRAEDCFEMIILEAAQIALKNGLTTVFDTWGPRAPLIKAREMINAGEAPGSRIYLAGNIIGFDGPLSADFNEQVARHVSKTFVERTNKAWEQGTGRQLLWLTPEEVRAAIREYVQKDIDFLKYAASGHADMNFITFSPRVQRVIVEEGHRADLIVQAHTTSVASMNLAMEAGVDILTHGDISGPTTAIPDEILGELVKRGVAVSVLPVTQRRLDALARVDRVGGKSNPYRSLYPYMKVAKTNRRNMIKAGVTMLLSTDALTHDPVLIAESPTMTALDSIDPNFKLGEGHFNALVALEEEGMDRMEILKSATSHIARAYKLDAEIGTLEPGKIADLVILDADPLESARNYRRIHAVIKDGRRVDRDALPVTPIITARTRTNCECE